MAGNPSFDIRETAAKALYEAHVAMAMEEGISVRPFYRGTGLCRGIGSRNGTKIDSGRWPQGRSCLVWMEVRDGQAPHRHAELRPVTCRLCTPRKHEINLFDTACEWDTYRRPGLICWSIRWRCCPR